MKTTKGKEIPYEGNYWMWAHNIHKKAGVHIDFKLAKYKNGKWVWDRESEPEIRK